MKSIKYTIRNANLLYYIHRLSLFNIIYTRGYRTGYCNIHAQLRNMLKQQFIS